MSILTSGWRIVVVSVVDDFPPMIDEIARSLGHRVVGVLTSQGPKRRRSTAHRRIAEWAPPGVDIIISNFPRHWAAMLAPLKPDLIVCFGLPWKIPQEVLDLATFGGVNGHPSLLPKYRGPGSMVVSWLFLNDEPETALTVHRLEADFDSGPILAQERVLIFDDDDISALVGRIFALRAKLFREAMERLADGEQGTPQNLDEGFYVEWLTDEQRTIDWAQPARVVHNRIRSWHGLDIPRGALGDVDSVPSIINRSQLVGTSQSSGGAPGSIVGWDGEFPLVQCGDGPLKILEWAPYANFGTQQAAD